MKKGTRKLNEVISLIPFSSLSIRVPKLQLRRIRIKALLLFKLLSTERKDHREQSWRESRLKFMFTNKILPQGLVT